MNTLQHDKPEVKKWVKNFKQFIRISPGTS